MDIEALRRLIDYDPATGELIWKPRVPSDFSPSSKGGQASACKRFNDRWAGQPALNSVTERGYRAGNLNMVHTKAHRVAFALANGRWPEREIDHINGDTSDNRACNLREVSHAINGRNQRRRTTSKTGKMGVYLYRKTMRWGAVVNGDAGRVFLGYHDTFDQARLAREAAEARLGYHSNHGAR